MVYTQTVCVIEIAIDLVIDEETIIWRRLGEAFDKHQKEIKSINIPSLKFNNSEVILRVPPKTGLRIWRGNVPFLVFNLPFQIYNPPWGVRNVWETNYACKDLHYYAQFFNGGYEEMSLTRQVLKTRIEDVLHEQLSVLFKPDVMHIWDDIIKSEFDKNYRRIFLMEIIQVRDNLLDIQTDDKTFQELIQDM